PRPGRVRGEAAGDAQRSALRSRAHAQGSRSGETASIRRRGGRIRESWRAGANKQLISAYFGSKRELFDRVVTDEVVRFHHDDNPAIVRLGAWNSLEPSPADKPIAAHTVRNATVGGIRDAGTAGIRPANAPIRMAAAMPPDHASAGITTVQFFEVA